MKDGTRRGSMEIMARHLLNLSRLTPEGSSSEVAVLETLFCMILQSPSHCSSLMHRVMLEINRLEPSLVPPVVASGVWSLYSLVPAMDATAWRQLAGDLENR